MTEQNKKLLEYFKGDDVASYVWKTKYAYKDEITPDDMHRRMAREFARVDATYPQSHPELSEYGRERTPLTEDSIFSLFEHYKTIVPQGSVMATLGTDVIASLSNCYVLPEPFDSYSGILHTDAEMAQLFKRRGGVGTGISSLRPSGLATNNTAKTSTGAVSFMHRYSNTTREVAMNGRRGALMLTIDCRHPDVFEFVNIKKDRSKVTGANISVLLRNDFMRAVKNDRGYILQWPCETYLNVSKYDEWYPDWDNGELNYIPKDDVYVRVIKAKELYDQIVENAWDNAEPGQIFLDRVQNYCPDGVYPEYKPKNPNPCQPKNATLLSPHGITTMENVKEGDVIWSGTGWTTILKKWSTGVKPVYRFNTSTGYFLGTEEHKIVSHGEKVKVKDATTIDWNVGEVPKFSGFNSQTVMDGLVLGDGSVHKASNNLVYLLIGKNDYDYFDSDIAPLIKKHRGGLTNSNTAYEINTTITSTELTKTYDRQIPSRIFHGDITTKLSFLRGLYSANGSVVNNRITLKQSSKKLIEQVREMLSSVGIKSYITVNKTKTVNFKNGDYMCKESYDLNISTHRDLFLKNIGFIQRYKTDKIKIVKSKEKTFSSISEKLFIGNEEVFDITVDDALHTYWTGGVLVSNCAEEMLQPYDSCRLMLLNLFSFVKHPFTPNAYIDYPLLYKMSYEMMVLGDDLIDLEMEHLERIINKINNDPEPDYIKLPELALWKKVMETASSARRFGGGSTALADVLAALGIAYDSDAAISVVETIMATKMRGELDATIDMAILRGTFKGFDVNKEFEKDAFNVYGKNDFYEMLVDEFPAQVKRMVVHGRRNVSWNTLSPAGSVSTQTQTTSSGEPIFDIVSIRRVKINADGKGRVDFVDPNGDSWTEYPVLHPKFQDWMVLSNYCTTLQMEEHLSGKTPFSKDVINACVKVSPWYGSTANDIDWIKRVKMQSVIQKYTTNAISSTINLPKTVTKEEVGAIYLEAYEQGCKGVTVYRDECRTGVLLKENTTKNTITTNNAPKRPKKLKGIINTITSKGTKWNVIVGIFNGVPYEVFALHHFTNREEVEIVREGGGVYNLYLDGVLLKENITSQMNHEEETTTRLISTNLRHGVGIKFIVEQLNKTNGEVTSFSKAIARTLKTFIESGSTSSEKCPQCSSKLIYEEGCKKCSCGYSAC